jgi:hypothetical protein
MVNASRQAGNDVGVVVAGGLVGEATILIVGVLVGRIVELGRGVSLGRNGVAVGRTSEITTGFVDVASAWTNRARLCSNIGRPGPPNKNQTKMIMKSVNKIPNKYFRFILSKILFFAGDVLLVRSISDRRDITRLSTPDFSCFLAASTSLKYSRDLLSSWSEVFFDIRHFSTITIGSGLSIALISR